MSAPTRRGWAVALLVLAAAAGPAGAAFRDSGTASSGSVTTLVVAPPTGTTATATCRTGVLEVVGNTPVLSVAWTPTAQVRSGSGWSQDVHLVVGGALQPVATLLPVDATSSSADVHGTRSGGTVTRLSTGTSYTVLVRSTWGSSWQSARVAGAMATVTTPTVC